MEDSGLGIISLAESATRQITEMIRNGTFKEGDRLPPERELAVTLNLSRGALREALRTLETLGLVKARAGSGRYVCVSGFDDFSTGLSTWMSLQGVSDVIAVRRVLEPAAIEAIPSTRIEATARECGAIFGKMTTAFNRRSYDAATRYHTQFHMCLTQHAPTRLHRLLLVSMIRTGEITQREIFRTPEAGRFSIATHKAILDPLLQGNVVEAARRDAEHLTPAFVYPYEAVAEQPVEVVDS
jgi:GntR family transcriptional repressor for pyruvate dehydrogenase complex